MAKKLLSQLAPFQMIDVTLRDAHQCLWSTRMTTAQMYPALDNIDRAGYGYINILGGAVFDVMVLGLGEDGHTASLFPGTSATSVRDCAVTLGAGKGLERISITAPVLSAARQVIVLVSGAGKAQALQRLLDPAEASERTPAKLVQPQSPVLVLADAAAAGELTAPG